MFSIVEESDIQYNNKIIALYFYSSWMPFHKKMVLMISKIEEKYKDVTFYAINTDNFKSLCKVYDVNQIPTVVIKNSNKELGRIVGLSLTSAFKKVFSDIFNRKE